MGGLLDDRPVHGGYQDAFAAADLLPLARELAANEVDDETQAAQIRAGRCDDQLIIRVTTAALKWRFYAQPEFRAGVSRP